MSQYGMEIYLAPFQLIRPILMTLVKSQLIIKQRITGLAGPAVKANKPGLTGAVASSELGALQMLLIPSNLSQEVK